MINKLPSTVIRIAGVTLWAHVGVLDSERLLGQKFIVDMNFWIDSEKATYNDNLSSTIDYSCAVKSIQQLSMSINCQTIECFSAKIIDSLEELYGKIPMQIILKKCHPPIDGFSGNVSIESIRNFPAFDEK